MSKRVPTLICVLFLLIFATLLLHLSPSINFSWEYTHDYRVRIIVGQTSNAEEEAVVAESESAQPAESLSLLSSNNTLRCTAEYSSFECIDGKGTQLVYNASTYGFQVVNRTCVYHNVVWDHRHGWTYFARPGDATPPEVSLSSVPFDLPIRHLKRTMLRKKINPTMAWRPYIIRSGQKVPCGTEPFMDYIVGYYSPVVAPWNFAHTLFNDLFGVFWNWYEHGLHGDLERHRVVLCGVHYAEFIKQGQLLKNKAFQMFVRHSVHYDYRLKEGVYQTLTAGIGAKSWMFFNDQYRAPGSPTLWYAFRNHLLRVTGVADRTINTAPSSRKKLVICHKTDKRGLVGYEETARAVNESFRGRIDAVLVTLPKLSAAQQITAMVSADIFLCNEGTLATSFFLLPRGAVFVSVPLVYHSPHLHVTNIDPEKTNWWRSPDPMRPDPRKQTGGNIDWFPQAIPWVRVMWYAKIPLNETLIQLPAVNLRNYMPDYNVRVLPGRLHPLLEKALVWLEQRPHDEFPNFSINAAMCNVMLQRHPDLVVAFNTARCYFGKSWLCEFLTNTVPHRRYLHEKWRLSKGRCGGSKPRGYTPAEEGLVDPRDRWDINTFAFYNKDVKLKFDF